jgi:hypothetical protein
VARAKDHARGRGRAERLAVAAAGAGLPLEEVCRATGEAAWVVQALTEDPLPRPDDVDDADDADLWPLVLIPMHDITASDVRFTLEWWQAQDHLPRHQLVARADEQRREMYRPVGEW